MVQLMKDTIALIGPNRTDRLNDYVQRIFRDADSAHKFASALDRNVKLVELPGKWQVGQCIPPMRLKRLN